MSRRSWFVYKGAPLLFAALLSSAAAVAEDGFLSDGCLSPSALRSDPLTLVAAVSAALCSNAELKQAALNEQARQASIKAEKAAWLPTLEGQVYNGRASKEVDYTGYPELKQKLLTRTNAYGLNFQWLIFDFGQREFRINAAQALLESASSARQEKLQSVILSVTQAFYEVQSAQAMMAAKADVMESSRQDLNAAQAKYHNEVGEMSDLLQARTAYTRAELDRIQAENQYRQALGTLANAVGLPPSTPIRVVPMSEPARRDQISRFQGNVERLMDEAMRQHPSIARTRAQWQSDLAQARAQQRDGWPKVSLVANASRSDTPIDQSSVRQQVDTWSIGVQVSIPLFDGFANRQRARAALLDAQARGKELEQLERTVALNVWKSYEALNAYTQMLSLTQSLVNNANHSYSVAQGRYKEGVGTMMELLKAQADLAQAQQQHVESLSQWYESRAQLAADLGTITANQSHTP